MRVATFTTTVTSERTLIIRVPQDIPIGPAEVIVVSVAEPRAQPCHTLGELRTSEFFGMWRDRTDLPDSPAFARILRQQAWERPLQ